MTGASDGFAGVTEVGMEDPQVVSRRGDRVFHTYSSYARGTDLVDGIYNWLDLTARGRQEDWEQPPGRSDSPLMGWLRHHDRYGS
jgi:predicted dithiol-disulfide oxidoreductase (DUF899 family)